MDIDELRKKVDAAREVAHELSPAYARIRADMDTDSGFYTKKSWETVLRESGGDVHNAKSLLKSLMVILKPAEEGMVYFVDGKPAILATGGDYSTRIMLLGQNGRSVRHMFNYTYDHLGQLDKVMGDLFHAIDRNEMSPKEAAATLYAVNGLASSIRARSERSGEASRVVSKANGFALFCPLLMQALIESDESTLDYFRQRTKVPNLTDRRDGLSNTRKKVLNPKEAPTGEADILPFTPPQRDR